MGARGPRGKLDILDALDGRPGKRRKRPASGFEAFGRPEVPDWLPDDARACFAAILAGMPPDTYAACDVFLLTAYATTWTIHRRAAAAMADPGFQPLVSGRLNPWTRVANDAALALASFGDRLGLDPKARARLAPPGPGAPRSKFEGLMGGR